MRQTDKELESMQKSVFKMRFWKRDQQQQQQLEIKRKMTFVAKKRGCFDEQQHLMADDLVFVDKNVENVDKNVENVENDKMFHICRQPSTLHSPLQQLDR